ncbi:MAG: hypothetical protein ACRYFS_13550 [Janthinobacterium lividum]
MRSSVVIVFILVVVSLVATTGLARAQSASIVDNFRTGRTAGAVISPQQVEVTVDWIDIPDTDKYVPKVDFDISHDRKLMASLIENGAIDETGPRLQMTAGQFGCTHVKADIATTVLMDGKRQKRVLHLDNFTEGTPTIFADGSVSFDGTIQRAYRVPNVNPPAAFTDLDVFIVTMRDGETRLLSRRSSDTKQFVFVTVRTMPQETKSVK